MSSSNGGSTSGRRVLSERFRSKLTIDPRFTRKTVSYQGNRGSPGFRWMKYKEAFSQSLVEDMLDWHRPNRLLDPFSGVGTSILTAAGQGLDATGIEIMPVGVFAASSIADAANGLVVDDFVNESKSLLKHIESPGNTPSKHAFPHVRITRNAFSSQTERDLGKAREFLSMGKDCLVNRLLGFACMSVLEQISYTRKDGQFLRWDNRSGRSLRSKMHKGDIPSLAHALSHRLQEMTDDFPAVKKTFGGKPPRFITGSSLDLLRDFPSASIDLVITSPPYANRYDYTRTYALELAWMGLDQEGFSNLRQRMLTATVENHSKIETLRLSYAGTPDRFEQALSAYERQEALQEVLCILRDHVHELGNPNVIRLLEGYFLEMAIVIAELSRILRPDGYVVMVNDNVQYHGEEVPVDFIFADIAEGVGFECVNIWQLAKGKGNASQQMGRFGRREIRKCVYRWRKK
ncbi:MAG: site-specific DNA-methyltransferase [Rhodothermaceae bacterium]|nr:site-specific DNA-methyltransferase [Rhodothermaceae bacterium]MYE61970.1 site-specific DNA-methyltransferase [Rhodothermaceae bacterium]MYJ19588.1 site-specific DNA-methyltransferase [Rhodothermaceae bacterium]